MKRWGINKLVLLVALLPAITVAVFLAIYSVYSQLDSLEQVLSERGSSLVRQLGPASEYGVLTEDKNILEPIVNTIINEPDIRSVYIVNANSQAIIHKGSEIPRNLLIELHTNSEQKKENHERTSLLFSAPITQSSIIIDEVIETEIDAIEKFIPLDNTSNKVIGWVIVEIDLTRHNHHQRELLRNHILLTILILIFASVISFRISRHVTLPILNLTKAVSSVKEGKYKLNLDTNDDNELGHLAHGVQDMADSIKQSQDTLEKRIEEATEKYKTTQSQLELERDIADELREKEAQANIAKSKFLAVASHDLRQPLSAISLYTSVLIDKTSDIEELHDLAKRINMSVDGLQDLFNKLLDISKLDAGAIQPKCIDFNLTDLVSRISSEFKPAIEAKGLRLTTDFFEAVANTDQILLETILRNIISNACRYTENGEINVSISERPENIVIDITDTGTGIPDDKIQEVFSEFTQLHNPQRDRKQGIGLGLAIVDRLCKLLNIAIDVNSVERVGSSFSLYLPKGNPDNIIQIYKPHMMTNNLIGLYVYVIDDEQDILDALSMQLESWGCEVKTATSYQSVVAEMKNVSKVPDVLICDYRLPNHKTGLETITVINKILEQDIPALIITGDIDTETLKKIKDSGYPLLHKPVKPQRLKSFLTSIIRRTQIN